MRLAYPNLPRIAAAKARAIPLAIALALLLGSCDGRPRYYVDGGPDPDAAPLPDALPPSDAAGDIFAGMTINGCESQLATEDTVTCQGTVPLTLGFASLAPADASSFKWQFGDETPDAETPSTTHVYQSPGTYTVLLVVGGPFGSLSPPQLTQVEVTPAPVGAFCEKDAQCADGLCLCAPADATECPPILQGTCAAPCPACEPTTHCVDLSIAEAIIPPPWRSESCLPDCETDGDCLRPGFTCRELPAQDQALGRLWQPACFPDVLGDVGDACHDPDDTPDPGLCLSGRCGGLGRFGLCTDSCADTPCPSYASCVSFTDGPHAGEALCLSRCSPERPCTHDPQLTCEGPDAAGDLGFTLLDPTEPQGQTYCAPRRCAANPECPSSLCDLASGGFCL